MEERRRCPQCGGDVPADAPGALCPECLLELGMASRSDGGTGGRSDGVAPTISYPEEADASPTRQTVSPQAGQQFGGYHIVRSLGKGGMGAVYEAEHLESGRRVALKVLSHSLDSPDARKRFLREGRLAASVNHPNSVYVYGTEEIEGTPAISMELVAGGTLRDRVEQHGPLPVTEAVDTILEIIAGLEAAQAVGVLHRDVKPGNCFVDSRGTVKVGDFGLSISTSLRGESNLTIEGTFLGTPAFASPEHLRGDELDLRADIYAVGVTLYYLLTGRTPFDAKNLVQLLARVLECPAPSPAGLRSEMPKGLARVVLRCLEKQPAARYRSYDELRRALAPFTSAAPTPATLGLRFVAGAIDGAVLGVAVFLLCFAWFQDLAAIPFPDLFGSANYLLALAVNSVSYTLYFALAEGLWGASLGKLLCRLRVVGPNRSVAGVPKALVRAAVYVVFPQLVSVAYLAFTSASVMSGQADWLTWAVAYSYYVLLAVMFSTARRRNGFAGFHDFLSNTRVIVKSAHQARPVMPSQEEPLPDAESTPRIGPYYALDRLHGTDQEEVLLGYDARLLRRVWIRTLPDGEPPAAEAIRMLGRPGRLRWLGGRRSPGECWDAYEALSGRPLVSLLTERQPWRLVRYWLFDLAEELNAGLKDGSLPEVLALDRVWITADGRAKLLDFSAPGVDEQSRFLKLSPLAGRDFASARLFLTQVAAAALESRPVDSPEASRQPVAVPLPLHARTVLNELPTSEGPELPLSRLKPLLQKGAFVSRLRRLGLLAACLVLPILAAVCVLFADLINQRWLEQHPDVLPLRYCLRHLEGLQTANSTDGSRRAQERHALEVYIAGRFCRTISDPATLSSARVRGLITEDQRRIAERILATQPNPSKKEISGAAAILRPFLDKIPDRAAGMISEHFPLPVYGLIIAGGILLVWVAIPSLVCALLFRGGPLLRLFGIAVVNGDGSRASRLRAFWRSLIAWSPCLLFPVALVFLLPAVRSAFPGLGIAWTAYPLLAMVIALVVWSASMPDRALPDRIAGTYLVPR